MYIEHTLCAYTLSQVSFYCLCVIHVCTISYSPSFLCEILSDVMLAAVVLHMYTCVTIHIIIVHIMHTHMHVIVRNVHNNNVVASSLATIRYCDNQHSCL